jgi:MFS family permease
MAAASLSRVATTTQKWSVVALALILLTICTGVLQTSFTFFVSHWMAAFEVERTQVMSIISIHLVANGLASIVAGRLLDTMAPRPLVLAGLGCLALSAIVVALAPSLWAVIVAYALVAPVAASFVGPLAAMTLVARAFEGGRGMAMGVATLGVSLAGVVFPFLVVFLLKDGDWRNAYAVLGIVPAVIVAPLVWFVLSPAFSPSVSTLPPRANPGTPRPASSILRRADFWILVVAFQAVFAVGGGLTHNMRPLTADLQLAAEATALVVAAMSICNIIGKPIIGASADWIDNRFVFIGAGVLMMVAIGLLWAATGFVSVLIACCLLGFSLGGFMPLRGAMYATTFTPRAIGQALGLAGPFAVVIAAGPIAMSGLRDASGDYGLALLAGIAVLALVAPVTLLLSRKVAATAGAAPSVAG